MGAKNQLTQPSMFFFLYLSHLYKFLCMLFGSKLTS